MGSGASTISTQLEEASDADLQAVVAGLSPEIKSKISQALDGTLETGAPPSEAAVEQDAPSAKGSVAKASLPSIVVTSLPGTRHEIHGILPKDSLRKLRLEVYKTFCIAEDQNLDLMMGSRMFKHYEYSVSLNKLAVWKNENASPEDLTFVAFQQVTELKAADFKVWDDKGVHLTYLPLNLTCSQKDTEERYDIHGERFPEKFFFKPVLSFEKTEDPKMPRVVINYVSKTFQGDPFTMCQHVILRDGKLHFRHYDKYERQTRFVIDDRKHPPEPDEIERDRENFFFVEMGI